MLQAVGRLSIRGINDARETVSAVETDAQRSASAAARNDVGSILRVGEEMCRFVCVDQDAW